MVRGIYTGASGMMVNMKQLNTIANNLANVNTDGYKRETSVSKAFPELQIRRINDDGVVTFPLGSYDLAPVVGKLGTGVEFNESYVRFEQGSLQGTENDFDMALEGHGFFTVMTAEGERYTRNGNFNISKNGFLVDKHGNKVLGEKGAIRIGRNNFQVDDDGNVFVNQSIPPEGFTSKANNNWKNQVLLDKLKIVDFPDRRYAKKEGYTWYKEGEFSGKPFVLRGVNRPKVHQGFLEKSNVNPVIEMTRMIEVQRLYEANQRSIHTEDQMLGKAVNEVGRGLA